MPPSSSPTPTITSRAFGRTPDGRDVREHVLDNGRGLRLGVIDLGGIVRELHCPDRDGRSANVVLGFADLADYLERNPHFGTLVGRVANRIAGGRFTLDGEAHQLTLNEGQNSLHGGLVGFGKRWWHVEPQPIGVDGSVALALSLVSEDGDQGYPGTLQVHVRYTLTPASEWRVDYRATTDRPTVLNLTNHSYFNLAGGGSVLDHVLTLHASRVVEIDAQMIPTRIAEVAGSPFDFRKPTTIGDRIRCAAQQLLVARGYDHNWVLDDAAGGDGRGVRPRPAARLVAPRSGRVLEIETTEPGVQFYAGNQLDGTLVGSAGRTYRQSDGLCLETQHFPDSPNRPDFPSTVLRPGETFTSTTVHRFSTTADGAP
jgi:aldose 1-epimerase